jgi:predicted transcriptional regulator
VKPVCEVIVREVLPAVRSILAKELLDAGLTQKQVAQKLDLTQPAVSQYVKKARGKNARILTKNKEVSKVLRRAVKDITNDAVGDYDLIFCDICHEIRNTGAVCRFHEAAAECNRCMSEECK